MADADPVVPEQLSSQVSRPQLKSVVSVPEVVSPNPRPRSEPAIKPIDGGWQVVGGRKCSRPMERRPQVMTRFKELLFRRARGKCFKCLSPEHRIAECRNLAKCLLCGESEHKARWCKGEQSKQARAPAAGISLSLRLRRRCVLQRRPENLLQLAFLHARPSSEARRLLRPTLRHARPWCAPRHYARRPLQLRRAGSIGMGWWR
jgi:hypothetical protein